MNFKGIGELTLDLTNPVTTLIGLNESGKTTILEGIFCFGYGRDDLYGLNPDLKSLRDPQKWIPVSKRSNFNDQIRLRARVEMDDEDVENLREHLREQHGFNLDSFPNDFTITEVYHYADSRHLPDKKEKVWSIGGLDGKPTDTNEYLDAGDFDAETPEWQAAVVFVRDELLPSIWYFPNFLFDLPDSFRIAAVPADDDDGSAAVYQQTFEQVLSEVGKGTTLARHVIERTHSEEPADKTSLDAVLLDMGRIITQAFSEGWSRIFGRTNSGLEIQVKAAAAGAEEADLSLRIKSSDGYFELCDRSLGFRWFFMFLLMTRYRGLDARQRPVVFLLDEPASNLHSSAQAQLLKSFEALMESCQLIYTTHSHHLINLRWLDGAYVVANTAIQDLSLDGILDAAGSSAVTDISAVPYRRFVNDHPSKVSYYQPVLDLLQYRPSGLEPVPEAVLVEGKSDFALLSYCADVIGLPCPQAIVPGSSATTMDTLIALHLGWGKNFVVLLDSDEAGSGQKRRYLELFGPIMADRIVTLRQLARDPEVTAIESLLTQKDQKKLVDAAVPVDGRPVAKKALRQAIQLLLASNRIVDLSPTSSKRVEAVLEGLDQRFDKAERT